MKTIRRISFLLLVIQPLEAFAASAMQSPLGVQPNEIQQMSASEFVYKNTPDENLMPVYLIGAVNRAGLYHVPFGTSITDLLALSSGTRADAETSRILIKRPQPDRTFHVAEVDFDKVMAKADMPIPTLSSRDIVFVPAKEPAVSSNTFMIVGLTSGILAIILSTLFIRRDLRTK